MMILTMNVENANDEPRRGEIQIALPTKYVGIGWVLIRGMYEAIIFPPKRGVDLECITE
jgi:hypothetical protein